MDPAPYQCDECNHHFDEPAERERLGPSHRNGLANTLDQLDPAEVP